MEEREKSLEREIRAFHWARLLSEIPQRLAASAGEREAARRVEVWLRELGFDELRQVAVASRSQPEPQRALHLAVGALACAWGGLLGAALALLAGVSLRRERRGGPPLLGRWLPAPDTANVIARAGAAEPSQCVVLTAALDAPRRAWLHAQAPLALLARRGPCGAGAERWLLAAALAIGLGAVGASGWAADAARAGLFVALACAAAACAQASVARASAGARQSAAVAALLTCAEQLLSQLPEDAALWAVATGSGHAGDRGLEAFLRSREVGRADASYRVEFAPLGGAELGYGRAEHGADAPTLVELARRVAASGAFGSIRELPASRSAAASRELPGATPALVLASPPADPASPAYAPGSELPEDLDTATVVRAADFGAAVARAALRGEAGPIALV